MVIDDRSSACPEPEQLASYVDGTLTAEDHAAIQRHLADCDDCRETVAGVVHSEQDKRLQHTESRGRLLKFKEFLQRHKKEGGVLLLAASLLIVAQLRPDLNPFRRPTPFEELVTAVGTNRSVEGRLTGGFAYGSLRSATRGNRPERSADVAVLAAMAKLEEIAAKHPTAESSHRLGVAQLVIGNHAAAVGSLEDSAQRGPSDARILNDLAAAYLERGRDLRHRQDFERALAAAQKASSLDASQLEPYFNRALALEAMSLNDAARGAWADYISRDRGSEWRDEALRHMERLATSSRP